DNPSLRPFRPQQMVREFAQSLQRELDLAAEARNTRRVAASFAAYRDVDTPPGGGPPIVIPQVYWAGERVCVQQRIRGVPGTRLEGLAAAGLDRRMLARRGAHAVLKMIVQDGF